MMGFTTKTRIALAVAALALGTMAGRADARDVWTVEQAQAWGTKTGWLVGCDYIPAYAINQLEMFQADTFNPAEIDKELGWAEGIGFNVLRVYLHDLLWEQDKEGFQKRLDTFLSITEKHHIKVIFVLFDSCWLPDPKMGKQPEPRSGVHNSGWLQAPGDVNLFKPDREPLYEAYVKGLVAHFKGDDRVAAWDMWNEPPLPDVRTPVAQEDPKSEFRQKRVDASRALMEKAFTWARQAEASQPLTSGIWVHPRPDHPGLVGVEQSQVKQSDIITFHCYDAPDTARWVATAIKTLANGRPAVCTEYMARPQKSTFDPVLGIWKAAGIGALNWGFVSGKTNTIFKWDSPEQAGVAWQDAKQQKPWFHDIFRPDGTPYDEKEVAYIRKVTGKGEK